MEDLKVRRLTVGKNNIFDMAKFLDVQYDIYKKFIPPTHSNTCLERFDKILINLNEEMVEYVDEKEFKDKVDELVDVIMYTGTSIVIWKDEFPEQYEMALKNCNNTYKPEDYEGNLIRIFSKYHFDIIRLRRNFSERKWHKPHNPDEIKEPIVYDIMMLNLKYINAYINQLFYYDIYMETVIDRIKRKQNIILSL